MIPITENEFIKLSEYIKEKYGINLIQKKTLIVGRLQNFLIQNNFKSFSEYYNHIVSDVVGTAATTLINKLTTNHTFFMREPEHFDYFKNNILPQLVTSESAKKDLRIWSAGCSSGEEPYTLAMIIADYFSSDKWLWDTKILATDISTTVLEKAVDGIYSNEGIASLQENWRRSYFKRIDHEKSIIVDQIKKEVIFRKLNLMDAVFPFKKKFHVIFCRNVMIYFDNKTRKELIDKFYEFTEPGGYLFIGHSESLNRDETKYKYILPAIYRKD
jgi:chemotaxis protein methyltransferase CheR